jgi:hypothetical protein
MLSSNAVKREAIKPELENVFPEPRDQDAALGFSVCNLLNAIESGNFDVSKDYLKHAWVALKAKDLHWGPGTQQDAEEFIHLFAGGFRRYILGPSWENVVHPLVSILLNPSELGRHLTLLFRMNASGVTVIPGQILSQS